MALVREGEVIKETLKDFTMHLDLLIANLNFRVWMLQSQNSLKTWILLALWKPGLQWQDSSKPKLVTKKECVWSGSIPKKFPTLLSSTSNVCFRMISRVFSYHVETSFNDHLRHFMCDVLNIQGSEKCGNRLKVNILLKFCFNISMLLQDPRVIMIGFSPHMSEDD